MSRFRAELAVTLTDGSTIVECFNQAEMAHFARNAMLERMERGEAVVIFDGEPIEIAPSRIASIQVAVQDLVGV